MKSGTLAEGGTVIEKKKVLNRGEKEGKDVQ